MPQWWLDPTYTHGAAIFRPKHMSAQELERGHFNVQREFYSLRSILARFLEPRANARDLWRAATFLALNLPAYGEEMRRDGRPLGAQNA